ncbi:MAG: TonB family protein [bacterium]|nr:TonB family protein [bacterium]
MKDNAREFPPASDGNRRRSRVNGIFQNKRFRIAWASSFALHALLFVWVTLAPSKPRYRYFGSGTAVSLVGADEIPGGSTRGKSGDRPQRRPPDAKPKQIRKTRQTASAKKTDAQALRKAKKPPPKVLSEREKRLLRQKSWRERYAKSLDSPKKETRVAKAEPAKPSPPARYGYPGQGGGDGQGGGSLGAGGGGVARTELERYYGLLAERVRSNWAIPLSLEKVENYRTTVTVDVSRDGRIRALKLDSSSGNRAYDDAALRAVAKAASPSFPPPPNTIEDAWLLLGFRFCGRSFCK